MNIYNVYPRGFCKGVVNAIEIAKKVKRENINEKVTILGLLVHNDFINNDMLELGIDVVYQPNKTRLELLEKIDEGIVIFTAHGVSNEVKKRAKQKGLIVVDATCEYVSEIHHIIDQKLEEGYKVMFLGKKGHPETEGVCSGRDVVIVETLADIKKIERGNEKWFITNQTTLSYDLVIEIYDYCQKNNISITNEICDATKTRQNAIRNIPKEVDLVFVIGDSKSSNSNKLLQISKEKVEDSYLISQKSDITCQMLKGKKLVAITAGASTPTYLINDVTNYLKEK